VTDPEWILIAVIAGVCIAFFAAFGFVQAYRESRRQKQLPGGFEVKLNTSDQSPVESERGNDHG
jgi:hypothetical protein